MSVPVFVGVAGWSYPDWEGIVYPSGVKDRLTYLSGFMDCIEINSTFYRPPEQTYCRTWLDRTKHTKDFFFTAKLHKDFTHQGMIEASMIRQFHRGFEPLLNAGKLRHLLIQFRYDFHDTPDHRHHLDTLVKQFSSAFDLVVEVRHRSWQQPEALAYLEGLNITVANIDYPIGKDSFDLKTCDIGRTGYLRLHGRNAEKWFTKSSRDETYDYYYNTGELKEIQERVTELLKAYTSMVVIANNHYKGSEVANALELKASLKDRKVNVPESLLLCYPHLQEVAVNRALF